jgi:uncharacterized protein (TIGR02145 family)
MEVQMKHIFFVIFLLVFYSISYSQNPCPGVPTVDYGGKTYHTVQIGSQCWLKENLDVGTMIDSMANASNNGIIEKYCYRNNPANCTIYGGLYQWKEAMQYDSTQGARGICPTGWHIPDTSDFVLLLTTVNFDGNALKAVGQGILDQYGDGRGTNTSGFSALLTSARDLNGSFYDLGDATFFWCSTLDSITREGAPAVGLFNDKSDFTGWAYFLDEGYSIRCIKDASTGINDHSKNILPNSIELFQNYPNPFNPSTTISYTLPEKSRVVLSIYNELGEKAADLFNGEEEAGVHNIEWNASKFASGVYFYELKTEKYRAVKKLSLMK